MVSRRPNALVRTALPCGALLLVLFILFPLRAGAEKAWLPAPTSKQRTAIRLLRETTAVVEENYARLPDLKKFYASGLFGMQRFVGEDHLKVNRESARLFTLAAKDKRFKVRFEGDGQHDTATFELAYRFVATQAAKDAGRDALEVMYAALRTMLPALDEFSAFLPPDAFREMEVETSGRYGGLGIRISVREGRLVVESPIEGTPAFRAGIQAGDFIVAVNGEDTRNFTLLDAVTRMRGPPGTIVRVSILRKGWPAPREFSIVRAIIRNKSVKSLILEKRFGYLRITTFHEGTTDELDRELDRLLEADVRGIILDLRNNPGGLLRQAVHVTEQFIPEGSMIVFTRGRYRDQVLHFRSNGDGVYLRQPLVVLVNGGSASASEIVAGALQDLDRAILIGQRTYGKGSVQTIIPLSNGAGVRITTSKYYTPLGREIHGKGIPPDVDVVNPPPPDASAVPPGGSSPRGRRRRGTRVPPIGESDPQLEVALEALREAGEGGLEEVRLAAIRVRDRRLKDISKADLPRDKTDH